MRVPGFAFQFARMPVIWRIGTFPIGYGQDYETEMVRVRFSRLGPFHVAVFRFKADARFFFKAPAPWEYSRPVPMFRFVFKLHRKRRPLRRGFAP